MNASLPRWRAAAALLAALSCAPAPAQTDRVLTDHVRARLVSELSRVVPYSSFWVGLRFKIKPGWHTYWINPGDSGLAASIEWELPEGVVAGDIRWPVPHRFAVGDLMNYGYSDEVILLTRLSAWPPVGTAGTITLAANVTWLVCADICVPEEGRFELTLATDGGTPAVDARARAMLDQYARLLPESGGGRARFHATPEHIRLRVPLPPDWPREHRDLWFFPRQFGVLAHAAAQPATVEADALVLNLARGELKHQRLARLRGVLVLRFGEHGERGLTVDAEPG